MEELLKTIEKLEPKICEIREYLHTYPDLSGDEKGTRDYIRKILEDNGIKTKVFQNYYGMIAEIVIDEKLPFIAYRADIDALPIIEKGDKPYKSKKEGIMHGCGHDAHAAILVGVLLTLQKHKNRLPYNIRGIFQHKEEVIDGGSIDLIKDGVLDNVKAIFGLHIYPYLKVGEIGFKYGEMMASADMFEIEIYGKSSHGARPHEGVDAILTAGMAVNSINHIVSRRIDPLHPAVISMGKIEGGTAPNVICDRVKLSGTVRTLNDEVRKEIKRMMEDAIKGITHSMGAGYHFNYIFGNPELVNDNKMVDLIIKSANDIGVTPIDLKTAVMGGEDFSNYLKVIKGGFFRLGTCGAEKGCVSQHNPNFDIDEKALVFGAKIMINLLKYL